MIRFVFFLVLLPSFLYAQISGKVISKTDNKPVAGASVFINNSTIGTISNENGEFRLSNLSQGKHELIVSILGFEKHSQVIDVPSRQQLTILLQEKSEQLNELLVTAFDKDGWKKWGLLFLETFIGTTSNGLKAKLKNTDDLRFRHNKKDNKLEVYALKPLIIENKSLGYTLEYHLELFEIDFEKKTNTYAGFPFFREDKKVTKAKLRNRENTYHASLMKFMRSLYHNNLKEDGYLVRKMIETPNTEKERVRNLQQKYTIKAFDEQNRLVSVSAPSYPPEIYNADSIAYFNKVLKQPNSTFSLIKDTLSASQIIKIDSENTRWLQFSDYLFVVNTKHFEEKEYLEHIRQFRVPAPQTSILILVKDEPLEIQENGNYFPPLNLFSGEYWGWSNKIADLLPLDYIPKSSTP